MNRLYIKLLGLLFALAFMFSCTTYFDTTAEYKDITVVYGLLDQTQKEQYLKINKAFLSEKDVLTYANDPDSNNYPYTLNVKLEEWNEDNFVQSFGFETTTIYNKEPGQFYNPEQLVYKWIGPDYPLAYEIIYWGQSPIDSIPTWLNTDNTYKLIIENPETGKVMTSETNLVADFSITKPTPYSTAIKFIPNQQNTRIFEWNNADYAAKYEVEMLFHYYEVKGSTNTSETFISVWGKSLTAQQGDSKVTVVFADDQFFSACNTLIPYPDTEIENEITARIDRYIEIIVSAAEENFSLYLEVNEPSTSIVQDKPQYSNILNENGELSDDALGIFSSRAFTKTFKRDYSESMTDLNEMYPYLKF